uniref:Uncharacterized protein n=1 Tax=viral metagenome TaxID=1070528 RepID=A0A6M3L061_9ZZZZ
MEQIEEVEKFVENMIQDGDTNLKHIINFIGKISASPQIGFANQVNALVMPKIAEGLNEIVNDWDKEEDKVDEQIKFLRDHKFELEAIAAYNKRNEMTNRRLKLQNFIRSNFSE